MVRTLTIAIALSLLGGCKERQPEPSGMPAADNWSAPSPMGSQVGGHAGHAADPHAGMNTGAGDPHAGIDMGAADPHAGMNMDPQMAAIQPPDPDRPIDESKFLAGRVTATSEVASKIRPGAILFFSARPIDPVTGEIIGGPIAVARVEVGELPLSFRLTEANAMSAGTHFEGQVLLQAWIDGDGEAKTKQPGDVSGQLRATIPASKLALELDTVLR